jgi:hypothetical protein
MIFVVIKIHSFLLGFSFRVSMWQMWGIILLQIRMDINLWLRDGKEQKIKISQN